MTATAGDRDTARGRRTGALVVLLLASTLGVMAGAIVMPVLEVIRTDLGVDGTAAGFIITAHGLAIAVISPLVGRLIDRHGVRMPLAAGLVLYGLAGGAGMLVDSFPWLIASRLLLGIGAATVFSGTTVALLSLYDGARRDRVLGWRTTATTLGGLIWPLLAGVLGGFSWHASFAIYLIGIPLGIATLLTMPTGTNAASGGEDRHGAVRMLRDRPGLLALYGLMITLGLVMYSIAVFLPQRAAEIGVHDPFLVSLFMAITSTASGIIGVSYARIRARFDYSTLLRIALGCWIAGFVVLGAVSSYTAMLGAAALFGVANAVLLPVITVLIGDAAGPAQRGRATALSGTAMFAGQFLSPLVFGPLMAATSITTGYLVAAGACAAIFIALLSTRIATPHDAART